MSEKLQILIEAILAKTTKEQLIQELNKIEKGLKPINIDVNVDKIAKQFDVLVDGTKELKKVTTDVTNQFGQQIKTIENIGGKTQEVVSNNYKAQKEALIKISDTARKLTYDENQNRLKQTTKTQESIERFITQSNESIAQRNMRSEMLNIDPTQYEKLWQKLLYEQDERLIKEKKQTSEIQRQINLYKEQLAIKNQNLKTTYGKFYDSSGMNSILSSANNLKASDFITIDELKKTTKQLDLEVGKSTANMRKLRREATLAMKESDTWMKTLTKDFGKMLAWGVVGTAIYGTIRQIKLGLKTLQELDTLMVDIAKVTNLTADAMERLVKGSFDAASSYGRTAQDYLKAVAEFSRAGYEDQAKGLSEISLLAQNVGELTAEQANAFLIATDAAYKYSGSQSELTRVLDGVNQIDNKFATSIQKVSEGITVAGSIAANAGVDINELSAAVGTMTAISQRSGNEAGRAFRSILMNIRQIKGYQISPYVQKCA
jgi:FtsZ-binding cell division protein ZapB